ncbi:MAG: 1,4-beta-xylanase, partial [Treponema sp.]|nr:1,4-beta-xylanase [Treponema sp.]
MWLNAPSGVLHRDGSEKPVYHALDNLIHKEWHTEEILKTDENGRITVKGFKGKYILETLSGEKLLEFSI